MADVEQELIDATRAESQFDLSEPFHSLDIDNVVAEALHAYREPAQRNVLLLELAGVCVIDGESHETEVQILAAFAAAFGISQEKLDDFIEFARSAQHLVSRAEELIAAEDELG